MDLHSYAKRRTPKKWTIEQKRKLVEARIAHDAWFSNKPSSVVPWKNILITANLDDFNVFFVRKQWSNMLARYKMYKQTRLGSNIASKAIDAELIKRINQEWEFFEPIHKFMTRKTTNLHSYALTHRTDNSNSEQRETGVEALLTSTITEPEHQYHEAIKAPAKLLNNKTITINLPKDCVKENIPNNTTILVQSNNISQNDGIHLFSSDTSNDFQVIAETTRIISGSKEPTAVGQDEDENMDFVRNTDHDFYSKRSSLGEMASAVRCHEDDELQEQQSNYFADDSEESRGSLNMVVDLLQSINTTRNVTHLNEKIVNDTQLPAIEIKSENITICENETINVKEEIPDQEFLNDMPSTSTQTNLTHTITNPRIFTKSSISERDKYYRHKRRFNRRLEKRFDALLQVMGQFVKTVYPNIDVTPLEGTISSLATSMGKVLSSDSEDDNASDDSIANIPTTTQVNK